MRRQNVGPDNLWGLGEIARYAGVNKNVASNWHMRYDDFPEPFARLIGGSIWVKDEMIEWLTTEHTTATKRTRKAKVKLNVYDPQSDS